MYQITTAVNKIQSLQKRIKVVKGGTSAGKTIAILLVLIDKAIRNPNIEISIVAESIPHLKRGAQKDFLKIVKFLNIFSRDRWNATNRIYTFTNGSYIEFFSADKDEKLRGARRNVLYINECNNVSFDAYNELAIRTADEIYLDFNPVQEFWVDEFMVNDKDAEWLTITYLDNEALDKSIVREIEKNRDKATTSDYWKNWWNVYGLGLTGKLEGIMFENLQYFDKKDTDLSQGIFFSFIDPANGGGDYMCCFIACLLNDKVYIVDALYSKQSSSYTFPLLEQLFKRYNTHINFFELNSFGNMFAKHFRDKGFSIDGYNQTKSKLTRILWSVYFVEKMYFARESSQMYNEALKHIEEFPMDGKAKNDDAPDCLQLIAFYFENKYPHIFKEN